MIPRIQFGRTGHQSSRVIFGGYALSSVPQEEADLVLELLLAYGINHIDTAPMYGKSEERIGPWMETHREKFFLATKTRKRTFEGAWRDLMGSLKRLRVDRIDLWQMHGLTNPVGCEKAMGPGGALEAFLEARERGLVRNLGVTGHGTQVAKMHLQSLERHNFESVLLPYNFITMQNKRYAADFERLMKLCFEREAAIQTIKSVARRPWGNKPKTHNTYLYEPLVEQEAIDKAVHWSLGLKGSFMITPGDVQILPKVLKAASSFEEAPPDHEMETIVEAHDFQPIFS